MKARKIILSVGIFMLCTLCALPSQAQFLKKLGKRVKERAEQTFNRKVDKTTEEKTNAVLDSVLTVGKKKPKKNDPSVEQAEPSAETENAAEDTQMEEALPIDSSAAVETETSFEAYSKYDFIPGEDLLAFEDFSQDEVGDLPARWNTNTSAEVVTLNGMDGKWMKVGKGVSSYTADFIDEVPENFTLEFDVIFDFDVNKWAYSRSLGFLLSDIENPNYHLNNWQAGSNLLRMNLLYEKGSEYYKRASNASLNSEGAKTVEGLNKKDFVKGKPFHVSIWRQKTRLRVYVGKEKVFDVPRAIEKGVVAKSLRFQSQITEEGENAYISNIRYAVGKPDMRSKLLSEGRLVTYGITFDTGSAHIKPESTGTLKKIAKILIANPTLNVMIIGHTDADGDEQMNMELSENRASAVQKALVDQFGVGAAQLSTMGKGETELLDMGTSSESKAKNRRVEFVKQ